MRIGRTTTAALCALCALGGVAAYHVGRARADGVPTVSPLYYGGVLDDSGRPVDGARSVTVRVWDAATGGTTVCTTAAPGTAFSAGRFRVALDNACAAAVRANPNLWAEVQVDATTFPRTKLGAVPYALEAGRAAGASGPLETRIAAIERRDGGAGGGARQVVIGDGGIPRTCASALTPGTSPSPLTFVATATALYRVSTTIRSPCTFYRNAFARITASTAVSFLVRQEASVGGTDSGGTTCPEVPLFAIVALDAGQSYTFSVEVCGMVSGATPLVIEQLN